MSNNKPIDKLAFIYIVNKKILMTLNKGSNTYYVPGGKRNDGETDHEALIREVKEELGVDLIPDTIKYYGTFTGQASNKPLGSQVRMTCYTATFSGKLQVCSEIENIAYHTYNQKNAVGSTAKIIFDDLRQKGLIE